jgi:hypothetical protein
MLLELDAKSRNALAALRSVDGYVDRWHSGGERGGLHRIVLGGGSPVPVTVHRPGPPRPGGRGRKLSVPADEVGFQRRDDGHCRLEF